MTLQVIGQWLLSNSSKIVSKRYNISKFEDPRFKITQVIVLTDTHTHRHTHSHTHTQTHTHAGVIDSCVSQKRNYNKLPASGSESPVAGTIKIMCWTGKISFVVLFNLKGPNWKNIKVWERTLFMKHSWMGQIQYQKCQKILWEVYIWLNCLTMKVKVKVTQVRTPPRF